jgi:D-glycero-D-manno-heptose 1,7-bisphosphate phosphatase
MNRAVFLDRDGVINRKAVEGEYITRWDEMVFLPGIAEAIGLLNRAGFVVIVASNQRCVAKGLVTSRDVEALHKQMTAKLAQQGGKIDAVYYCPHDYKDNCDCRKPAPGMLLDAARDRDIDMELSWMIGDSATDVQAGKRAGCKTVWITDSQNASGADLIATSLLDAIKQILRQEGRGSFPERLAV